MQLRPYQQELIHFLRESIRKGNNRLIAQLATGGGKTIVFCSIIHSALKKNSKVLILTDRIELLSQAGGSLENFGLFPYEIKAGEYPDLNYDLYVAMVETLNRRIDKPDYHNFINSLDLIVIDECHMRNFTKLFQHITPSTTVLGFTATPLRQGRKRPLSAEYQSIIEGVSIQQLISDGYLARPRYYGVKADLSDVKTKMGDYDQNQVAEKFSEQRLYVGVVENYEKITPGKKSIVFSSNIQNSIEICDQFISKGYDARHIDSSFSQNERENTLEWFNNSTNGILCNVGILTRGFDQPDIEAVILYRATKSLPLFLQMVGRGSRTTAHKKEFHILDFGNNIREHGFWHIDRKWSLEPPKKSKKKEDAMPIKECPNCMAILAISTMICSECGYVFQKSKEEQEFAELESLSYEDIKNEVEKGVSFERLEAIAAAKDYKKGWIFHQLKSVQDLKKYAKYKGYHPRWVNYQLKKNENRK